MLLKTEFTIDIICVLNITTIETNTSNNKIISIELIAGRDNNWELLCFILYNLFLNKIKNLILVFIKNESNLFIVILS